MTTMMDVRDSPLGPVLGLGLSPGPFLGRSAGASKGAATACGAAEEEAAGEEAARLRETTTIRQQRNGVGEEGIRRRAGATEPTEQVSRARTRQRACCCC
jgi:hypothetical protein